MQKKGDCSPYTWNLRLNSSLLDLEGRKMIARSVMDE
jgi:hypothetical protein